MLLIVVTGINTEEMLIVGRSIGEMLIEDVDRRNVDCRC